MIGAVRLLCQYAADNCSDIFLNTEGTLCDLLWGEGIPGVDANIESLGVFMRIFPEGVLDNDRRIGSYAQFQVYDPAMLMPPQKVLAAGRSLIPALILRKGAVAAQIHGHGPAAFRAAWDQFCRDFHVPLFRGHAPDNILVVIGFLMAGPAALPQTIVPLGIKQPLFI